VFKAGIFFVAILFLSGFHPPDELNPGSPAPDFAVVSMRGDSIRLSNLNGSLVFIDFWASWCLPCRKQNAELVKIQDKYRALARRKGLPIVFVAISMDTHPEFWRLAITKDNLSQRSQVCDFKGWESPLVKSYKIRRIPSSFLVGTDGKIMAKNIWGAALDAALAEEYNKLSN
jgi:thiol-disulfide isomerase/thioredoxin